MNDQVLEDDDGAGVDDLKDPVQQLAGVNNRRVGAGRPRSLDDQPVAGAGDVQIALKPRRFVVAARVDDGQHVDAGLKLDNVVVAAGIGVELEDGIAQAAAARAAVGERRRRQGGRDTTGLKEFKM